MLEHIDLNIDVLLYSLGNIYFNCIVGNYSIENYIFDYIFFVKMNKKNCFFRKNYFTFAWISSITRVMYPLNLEGVIM
jgi:hypothetical protein